MKRLALAILLLACASAGAQILRPDGESLPGALAGTVVDEHGSPVTQAEVRVYPVDSDDEAVRARTSLRGTFRIVGLPAGWFDLEVRRPGFAPLRVPGVELRLDSAGDLGPLVLTRGKSLEGRAVEPRGAPIQGAEVWVVPSQLANHRTWKAFQEAGPAAVTDQEGRFILQGLDPRKTLFLEVCRPGHLTGRISVESPEQGPIQVELPRAARLSGRVVGPNGKPVSGAAVHASLSGASRGDFDPPSSPCPQRNDFSSTKTDAEGRFTLQPLDDGLFEIGAWAEGYRETSPRLVEVEAERESAGLTFVLARVPRAPKTGERAPAAQTAPAGPTAQDGGVTPRPDTQVLLSGRIVGVDPEDLPDVEILASNPDQKIQTGFVDRHGIYRFLSLAPGEWQLSAVLVSDGRSANATIVIAPHDKNPRLDLIFPSEP